MKSILGLLALCISISLFAKKGVMNVKAKTAEPKKTGIVCCEINSLVEANDIRINKICLGNGKTVIEMEFVKSYNACTLLQYDILIDESGKQYLPTYHTGLTNCPTLTTANKGHKFYWGFEKLDTSTNNLKLKEDEKMHPNMIPLQWAEINIAHCKW